VAATVTPEGKNQMDSTRLRNLRALVCGLVLTALAVWAPRAGAYPSYDDGAGVGCVQCHFNGSDTGGFTGGNGILHQNHLAKFGITSCTLCHQHSGGEKPVLTYWSTDGFGCSGCHGNNYGETSLLSGLMKSTGYGLRQKHAALGVTECVSCHYPGSPVTGDPDPAPAILPETVPPPYYGRPTNNLTDPCSSAQESFDATVGLDNDGNGAADMADANCAAAVPTTTTTISTSTTTTSLPGGTKRIILYPGQSIQDAVDAAAPGGKIYLMPGTYQETHGGTNAVSVNKDGIQLIARNKPRQGLKVILQALPGQHNGVVVEPAVPNTRINGFRIKGFTIQGFANNGILTRYLDNFRIEGNESINNLENGIWPTLSANGLVKKNVSYGSEDSALWVEGSENVRVIQNDLHDSPTGLEITVSKNILAKRNHVHDNTTGIGLYHPSAASLPPLGGDGDWSIVRNYVHNNNKPNTAPPGSMSAQLPPGGGILVLGADRVHLDGNKTENNDFYGLAVVDWCLAVAGSPFDCSTSPPAVDPAPDDNSYVSNALANNGTNPIPFHGLQFFAADITVLLIGDHVNCFARNNTFSTYHGFTPLVLSKSCN
jgi:hypothetical protein